MSEKTVETDTVVIGAGPAGIAVAACLKRAGIQFEMLERSSEIGTRWRQHYDRLHLHTDRNHSNLPYFPMSRHYPKYPSRLQVIEYLEAYAKHFGLEARFNQEVTSARLINDCWETRTKEACYRSQCLVITTGYSRVPEIPTWPGQDSFQGRIAHSSMYRNGKSYRGQKVLVVGFGNSGGEIAIDLWENGATPSISVRSPVNVLPRDFLGLPILTTAIVMSRLPAWLADALAGPILRLKIGDLSRYGLHQLSYGPITQIKRDTRIPLIDVGTLDLIRKGNVRVFPGVDRFTEGGVVFSDGRHVDVDAVVLATGYRPRVDLFLEESQDWMDENGNPRESGEETMPGLFFCGFFVSPTGMLREIAIEAKRISNYIVEDRKRVYN